MFDYVIARAAANAKIEQLCSFGPRRDSLRPVHLLSGEYGISATPEIVWEVGGLIGTMRFEIMKDVGHFPVSENPTTFRGHILPVLKGNRYAHVQYPVRHN
jgi:pimeloyl-ACP methyl ester carboxylesterase